MADLRLREEMEIHNLYNLTETRDLFYKNWNPCSFAIYTCNPNLYFSWQFYFYYSWTLLKQFGGLRILAFLKTFIKRTLGTVHIAIHIIASYQRHDTENKNIYYFCSIYSLVIRNSCVVKSKLECASGVHSTFTITNSRKLESIRRKFATFLQQTVLA